MKKLVSMLLAASVAAGVCLSFTGCSPKAQGDTQVFTRSKETIRVGIISDLQLTAQGGSDTYDASFEKGLQFLKAKDVDMIINAGDYTDTALEEAYQNYKRIFDAVYPENERPITSYIMGNHDYWLPQLVDCWEIPFKGKMQKRFMAYTGETSPWTHKVVNGYHFIGLSPENGNMDGSAYDGKLEWAEAQIQLAIEQNPENPVFVISHAPPAGTVYMSETESAENLHKLFKKYPQVISLSGHSHAPLLEDRSIWQGEYTAINTQCLSYMCFEGGMLYEGDGDRYIEENPMCMIMEIGQGQVQIDRYSVLDGVKRGDTWTIRTPIDPANFQYTDAHRETQAKAPVFEQTPAFQVSFGELHSADNSNGKELLLTFNAAKHERYVYGYRVVLRNSAGKALRFENGKDENDNPLYREDLTFVSDFYLGYDKMSPVVTLHFNSRTKEIPDGTYTAVVTAYDSFGRESAPETVAFTISDENVTTAPGVS